MIKVLLLLDWLLLFVRPSYCELQESDGLKINTDLNHLIDPRAPESSSIAYVDSTHDDFLIDGSEQYQFADCAPNTSVQIPQDDAIIDSNTNIKKIRRQLSQSCRSSDSPGTSNKDPNPSSQPRKSPSKIFRPRPPLITPAGQCRSDEVFATCTGPEIDLGGSFIAWVMNCVRGT